MQEPPRDRLPDSTLALVWEGYRFISNRRARLGSDIFACRLLLREAICIGGPDAARLFYDTDLFRRAGVVPARIRKTLLGEGGIHGLDRDAHRHRKAMYLALMGPDRVAPFRRILTERLEAAAGRWQDRGRLDLFAETQALLCAAVCQWAGVPLSPEDVPARTRDLSLRVDAFGGIAWRNWRGRLARRRSERWMGDILAAARQRTRPAAPGSALERFAWARDLDGRLLDPHTAVVELLNVVRPVMAVPYFIDLAAAALLVHPELRDGVAGDDAMLACFVEEVRRYCPFTPFLGAESCREIAWHGFRIPAGTLVVLDVYGIHHDERIWRDADRFDPGRFRGWDGNPYTLLPQGGGEHAAGHRCPGEWLTIEALKVICRGLARMDIAGSATDLDFDLRRIPARLARPLRIAVRPRVGAAVSRLPS